MNPFNRAAGAASISAAAAIALTIAGACGRGPTIPSPGNGPVGATITITSTGVSPKDVTINRGEVVAFVNDDARNHEMASNPHPAHTDCPAINAVRVLAPGQSRNSANFDSPRTCGFHDHGNNTNVSLQGTITIR